MSDNKIKKTEVDSIIALCHILDIYHVFRKNLVEFMDSKSNKTNLNNLNKLGKLVNGKSLGVPKKVKTFYQDNRSIIDLINNYNNINNFISYNYDLHGNIKTDSCLELVYYHLLANQDQLHEILAVLEQLRKIGFKEIEFNENLDFTNVEYEVYTNFKYNSDIVYLDNIKVIPNYNDNVVKYKSTNSNYKIVFHPSSYFLSDSSKLIVNSLLLSLTNLPSKLTLETIEDLFNKIVMLKQNCNDLKNAVNLSVSIDDLKEQLDTTNKVVLQLQNVKNQEELLALLQKMRRELKLLQAESKIYNESIFQNNPDITYENIENEKKLYLHRRYLSQIDLD